MLYAIIENGGKQYKAIEGAFIDLDLLPEELGQKKLLDKALLLVDGDRLEVGTPYLSKVEVETTIIEHFKGPKITVFKYRPKQRYRVKTGHRQQYTRVIVDAINFPGKVETSKDNGDDSAVGADAPVKKVRSKPVSAEKKTVKKPTQKAKSASAEKKPPVKKIEKSGKTAEIKLPNTKSIEELDLGTRTTSNLQEAGIKNIGQLVKMLDAGDDKLMGIPGIGEKSIQDIKKKMKKIGYITKK